MGAQFPGVSFTALPAAPAALALRSDIAGFALRSRRGPLGAAVRVHGWREAVHHFGGLDARFDGGYALLGYFENGGEIAHVARVAPPGIQTAAAEWDAAGGVPAVQGARVGLAPRYRVEATSPGDWARGLRINVTYRRWGPSGSAELELLVRPSAEPEERIEHIVPERFVETVNALSRYVRWVPLAPVETPKRAELPTELKWPELSLAADPEPVAGVRAGYDAALELLMREPEVAIVVAPDLQRDAGDALPEADVIELWRSMLAASDAALDRMVVVDAPRAALNPALDAGQPVREFRAALTAGGALHGRAGALYYPYLWVRDALGTLAEPLRCVPPSGHVAGVVSRLDRERGAHHTPANARLRGAVAFEGEPSDEDRARRYQEGANLLRCHPREGMVVWGGRTLAIAPEDGGFLAHRRLLHRLVRAMRRVAEPLVFENNGPVLWLALGRALTTVLLSAFQAGALKGRRPEEAFRVNCDAELNPPEQIDLGRCVCQVSLAPAAPLEFIELRVALSREGTLEVLSP